MSTQIVATPDRAHTIALTAGPNRVLLAPQAGGSIAEFSSRFGDVVHHWLRPATAEAIAARDPLKMASFPLVPWCNRIRDGRSDFGARPVRLRPNFARSPHTIHGVGWQCEWSALDIGSDTALLHMRHEPDGWPYRFDAQQRFTLDANDGLLVELSLRNLDDVAMPAGLGHHPYLPRRRGTWLRAAVGHMWQSDAELLPTALVRDDTVEAVRRGFEIDALDLDNNFTGWERRATVQWPDTGTALELEAEPPLDHFVIYSPRGQDHFCIEPVSNCTDWMNLAQRGAADAGGTLLAPGGRLQARFWLRPRTSVTRPGG
jgi:aldose 1-epimerase